MLSKNTFYYILYTFFERSKALKNQRAHFFFFVLKFDKTNFFLSVDLARFFFILQLFKVTKPASLQRIWAVFNLSETFRLVILKTKDLYSTSAVKRNKLFTEHYGNG